jgi:hypothetical protein
VRKSLSPLTLALAITLLAPLTAQAAGIGINVPGGGSAVNKASLAGSTGATTGRVFLIYPGGSAPDGSTIGIYQALITSFNAAGVKPVIVVTGHSAPADVNAYASYVGALARQYGSSVAAWELWNEPDEAIWWGKSGGDPATYAALLKATYPKVHPYAPVFFGGLTGNDYAFLEQVYAAGGGGSFDGVATHTDTSCSIASPDSYFRNPDGRISQYSFLGLREVHQAMAANGDGGKPIWITELGWSTSTALCDTGMWAGQKPGGVSEADQAKFLSMAWHCLKDYPYVTNALWFNLEDDASGSGPGERFGIFGPNGAAKPSRQAFADVLAGKDPFAGQPCGDFAGPALTVAAPTEGALYTDVLPIQASASDSGGVGRITFLADGQKIRNFTTGLKSASQFPKTLNGEMDWQGGKHLALGPHTITIVALDGSGNTTTQDVHVTKVDPSRLTALPTKFSALVVAGHGAKRVVSTTVSAATTSAIGFRAVHKVKVVFQKYKGGRWKTAHKYTKTAKAPLRLKVKLEKARWRVQAYFPAKAPFKASRTPWKYFKV